MRYRVLILVFVLVCVMQAQVSPHPYRGTISTAGSDCSTATSCVTVTIPPETASATISVDADTGSWSGTIQFEGTMDGSHWIAMVPTSNSSSASSSTTATGTWQFNPSSYIKIRARASARVSGTAPTTINWSNATASNGGARINPLGAANDLTCFLGANVLGPCDTGNATYSSSTLFVPNLTLSGTATVGGLSWLKGGVKVGTGNISDGTTVVGKLACYSTSTHNYTLASHTTCTGSSLYLVGAIDHSTGTCNGGSTDKCDWFAGMPSRVACTFDAGNYIEGHFVGLSTTTDGLCKDIGTSSLSSVTTIGTVDQASGSGGGIIALQASMPQATAGSVAFSSITAGTNNNALVMGASGTFNLSAMSTTGGLTLPTGAGAVPTSAGVLSYDSTAKVPVIGNGTVTLPVGADCISWQSSAATGNTALTALTGANKTKLWYISLPCNIQASTGMCFRMTTADNSANLYDIGLYSYVTTTSSLAAHAGHTAGSVFGASANNICVNWSGGAKFLPRGDYILGLTGNATTLIIGGATIGAAPFSASTGTGSDTSGGDLNGTVPTPAKSWTVGQTPSVVIF